MASGGGTEGDRERPQWGVSPTKLTVPRKQPGRGRSGSMTGPASACALSARTASGPAMSSRAGHRTEGSQDAEHRRRVHHGAPGDPDRPDAERDRRGRCPDRSVHASRGGPGHVLLENDEGDAERAIARAVRDWIAAVGATTAFIEPGSPWENGSCESFNPKFRDGDRIRSPERGDLPFDGRGPRRDRGMAGPLESRQTPFVAGLPAASGGRPLAVTHRTADRVRGNRLGAETRPARRLKPDRPTGAGHPRSKDRTADFLVVSMNLAEGRFAGEYAMPSRVLGSRRAYWKRPIPSSIASRNRWAVTGSDVNGDSLSLVSSSPSSAS